MNGLRRWFAPLLLLGVALVLIGPTLRFPQRWATPYDWRYFQSAEEAYRISAVEHGQWPLWNPYLCGGEVALANPQSTIASPTFLLSILFGTPLGLKLSLLVLLFCALHGGFLLGRTFKLSTAASLVVGLGYGTCGWFALHLSSGHINFGGAALFPYLLVGYRRAIDRDPLWGLLGAGALAWIVGMGGTYTAPMAAVLVGVVALTDAIAERRARPLVVALAIGIAGAALIAFRLLPVMEFVSDHPRHVGENDSNSIVDLARALFAWRQTLEPVEGHRYWWHEYCCHLSYALFPLALVGAFDRRGRRSLLLLAVALGIAAGVAIPYGPWWLLRHLPLYRDLRVPSRYLILAALPIALLAGIGLDRLRARFDRSRPRAVPLLVALAIAAVGVEGVLFVRPTFQNVFVVERNRPEKRRPFRQERGDIRAMFAGILDGHGTLDCDEEAPLQRGELDVGDEPQVRLVDPSAGEAVQREWSPNRLVIEAHLRRATNVLINQNWNEHWGSEIGSVRSVAGRLGVALEPGHHRFAVYYRPRSFSVGLAISTTSLVAAVGLLVYRWRKARPAL